MHALPHEPRLAPSDFARFVALNAGLDEAAGPRADALRAVLARVDERVRAGSPEPPHAALPALLGAAMKPFGWLWNGYYVLRDDGKLHLGPAWGPPVCAELERSGGPLSSGMCFDALMLNQTVAAYDAKTWPGYVSCDAQSGLATASGIVSPIRNEGGRPFAVWDLDAIETIEPIDVRFVDVLFATLARTVEPPAL